jgi:hypothetical protein
MGLPYEIEELGLSYLEREVRQCQKGAGEMIGLVATIWAIL